MPSFLTSGSLSQTVDDHLAWLVEWHRVAFFDSGPRVAQAKKMTPPASFPAWYQSGIKSLPQDQPAMDHLAVIHDQLHTLARLVLMKTPDGEMLAAKDYESVLTKYREFMQGIRRLERAFAVAASGLDLLTGLRSRVGLQEDLVREHSRFLRTGSQFCIAIMDIDHFKTINDTHGHDAGDRVLAAVADHVSRSLRPFDDAYRLGGEEFLFCLKDADLATGLKVLERLRASLEKLPITVGGQSVSVTASFGITVGAKEIAVDEMLHKADQALYRAKHQGRNAIVVLDTAGI
jgi:diguanylate cyclase (GGDEF)-like protein